MTPALGRGISICSLAYRAANLNACTSTPSTIQQAALAARRLPTTSAPNPMTLFLSRNPPRRTIFTPTQQPETIHDKRTVVRPPHNMKPEHFAMKVGPDGKPVSLATPYSPKFVPVPPRLQPADTTERRNRLRGCLPVPRNVFPIDPDPDIAAYTRASKASRQHDVPIATEEASNLPPRSLRHSQRRAAAAVRRTALTEGLWGLFLRRNSLRRAARNRAARHRRRYDRAAAEPERLDDVWTRPTVRLHTAELAAVTLDRDAQELRRLSAQAWCRHDRALRDRRGDRKQALMELYVRAENFIVDEAEFVRRVEEEFREKRFCGTSSDHGEESIWDLMDSGPKGVYDTLYELGALNKAEWKQTSQRQRKLAEDLTGGKMF